MSLKNNQYNLIMNEYDYRRQQREAVLNARIKNVYLKIPAFSQIDSKLHRLAISEVESRIEGHTASSDLSEKLHALSDEKHSLLVENGFPGDYLDVPYICNDCKDTGYINGVHCHCFDDLANSLIYNNLIAYNKDIYLSDFSLSYYSKSQIDAKAKKSPYDLAKKALDIAHSFVDNFNEGFDNILLYGKPGTGKTHLSGCIGNEIIRLSHSVIYLSAFEMFTILKREAFSRSIYPDNEYLRLFSTDLLIIDDLGTEFSNSMTSSQLFELLNERILRKKSTLISTNLDLAGISDLYSERLFSRIMEFYTLVPLVGEDIRILRKTTTL